VTRKLVRILVLLAGLTLISGAVLAYLLNQKPPKQTEKIVFADQPASLIGQITIENAHGAYEISAQEGGFLLSDIPAAAVDVDKFTQLLSNCSSVYADGVISAEKADWQRYRLDQPAAAVQIEYLDGSALKLKIGDSEPVSKKVYVAVGDNEKQLYLMDPAQTAGFLAAKTAFISHSVTPNSGVSSPFSALRDVTFSGGMIDSPFTIESITDGNPEVKLRALSFGAATHIVRTSGGVYALDQTYGVDILGSLLGIEAEEIAGYNLTEDQISEFGFDAPLLQVDFDLKRSGAVTHLQLKIAPEESGRYFAHLNNSDIVYIISKLPFMDIKFEKLILRWFLTPLIMDLAGVQVETPEKIYEFKIDASDPKNPLIQLDGDELDPDRFRSFFRLITSAANDGVYLGETTGVENKETLLRITYQYRNPEKTPDVMDLKAGEVRRVYVIINGNCEFQMKDLFAVRVIEAVEKITGSEPIIESW